VFAEQASITSPDVAELDDLIANLARGHGQERRNSTYYEFHGDKPTPFQRVDGKVFPVWACQDCTTVAMGLFTIWTRVRPEFILLEIDHQVRLACGQYPLYGGAQFAFMVVEGADEPSKDRSARACGHMNHNR